MKWGDAVTYCQDLTLSGGGWHLPTISELRTLIRGCAATQTGGSCGVTDNCMDSGCRSDSCDGCSGSGPGANGCFWPSQFNGFCNPGCYWSSSAAAGQHPGHGWWQVCFDNGGIIFYGCYTNNDVGNVRCVR